ncbi:MAG: glycine cleavage system aminomethyltransferase GcvT, partial [Synergistaceae bacterium]|nr:glycine cleavage system aminomethyltransferase GcvT [Synergistaceae bacterium]
MKRTPMYEKHVAAGGRMVDFGGWELPVQYEATGIKTEHLTVRSKAGLFDVSHMGEITVEGRGAQAWLSS